MKAFKDFGTHCIERVEKTIEKLQQGKGILLMDAGKSQESVVKKGETANLPTKYGYFKTIPFLQLFNKLEHLVLLKGELDKEDTVLVRMHSSCATGDIFGSSRCDCGEQLQESMQLIEKEGKGIIVYLNQEGRGIGLMNKIHAYKLQDEGLDTVDANLELGCKIDERDYQIGANILKALGITRIRLLTNNPGKTESLKRYGIQVVETLPLIIKSNDYNRHYLETKKKRMGHNLELN